jgi:hypothetical protein
MVGRSLTSKVKHQKYTHNPTTSLARRRHVPTTSTWNRWGSHHSTCTSSGTDSPKRRFGGIIRALPANKALSPDGFTACFLQSTRDIIRPDLMHAFDALWRMDTRELHSINEALMILLPKTSEASTIRDYRPISLIHVMGKLVSKVLVNRLATRIDELVHPSQSAFISGHLIQDSYKVVHASSKLLHARHL